jgi:hypothetical protein
VPNVSLQADLSSRVAVEGAAPPWHSSWKEFVGWSWAKRESANRSMAQPVNSGPLPNAKTLSAMYNNAVAVARLRSPTAFCITPNVGPSDAYWKNPARLSRAVALIQSDWSSASR